MQNKKLQFWPWMWSENKMKILVPLLLIVASIYNITQRNFDVGFFFLYILSAAATLVVLFGIRNHWKLLMELQNKNQL